MNRHTARVFKAREDLSNAYQWRGPDGQRNDRQIGLARMKLAKALELWAGQQDTIPVDKSDLAPRLVDPAMRSYAAPRREQQPARSDPLEPMSDPWQMLGAYHRAEVAAGVKPTPCILGCGAWTTTEVCATCASVMEAAEHVCSHLCNGDIHYVNGQMSRWIDGQWQPASEAIRGMGSRAIDHYRTERESKVPSFSCGTPLYENPEVPWIVRKFARFMHNHMEVQG